MMTTLSNSTSPIPVDALIAVKLAAVRAHVEAAAMRAGRNPAEVTVIAVSKTISVKRLQSAWGSGLTDLGENRIQEAGPKIAALGRDVTWHLIGHLQRNKAKVAVQLFDLIHSVDSLELASTLERHAAAMSTEQRVLFQVNISGEQSKNGFEPDDLRACAPSLAALPYLSCEGLMTIAPLGSSEAELRTIFSALRMLREELAATFADHPWQHLSMGMTDDYEIAVEEGATFVRVGRAIFGDRPAPTPPLPSEGVL